MRRSNLHSKTAKPRAKKEEGGTGSTSTTSPSGSQQRKAKVSHTQRRRDELAQLSPFTPHSALPVSSTSFYSPLLFNQALRKDSARSYLFTPPFILLFRLDIAYCSPFKPTACHTASTFYATQEKEQEAGKIRVVVVASQVAIDTQDYFFFCKSSGLESSGISPPIHFIFFMFAIFQ